MNSFSGTYTQLFSLSLPFESKPKLNTKTLLQEKTSSGYTNLQMSNNWGNGMSKLNGHTLFPSG